MLDDGSDIIKDINKYIEPIVTWILICETGYYSKSVDAMKYGKEAMQAILKLGITPRTGDDPTTDDDSDLSFDFKDCNFTSNGLARFLSHSGTTELAMDYILYVFFCLV